MKFCYVDESGTGDEPFAVMAGVLVDAYRMRQTKEDWSVLMNHLAEMTGREIKEFHTKDFYAGNSPWRSLEGRDRAAVLSAIFEWYAERRHHIVFSAIDKRKYEGVKDGHAFCQSIGDLWQTLALHVALAIQRHFQKQKNNKGNTVLIFDNHDKNVTSYPELILNPPDWTDTYYFRDEKKQKKLDQIVDVPHFVDSANVGMIQLADCISYFLRRHIEIKAGIVPARYKGEEKQVNEWIDLVLRRAIPMAAIYPQRNRCEASEFFYSLSPDSVKGSQV